MPSDRDSDEDEEEKTTWTAEEIAEWEKENDGICPAFRVDHRPERQPVSGRVCLWKDCGDEDAVVVKVYSSTEQERSRVCEDHLNALRSQSGISVEVEDSELRADGGRPTDGTTQREVIDTGDGPVAEDDEVIDEDVGLTRSGLMGMVGKNIVCDECGELSLRFKQGVDSNRCRHCGNTIEDAWSDDDD